mmetsp:Transcript_10803/g.35797  ORF Transcript_10803/g.35797 Transcript_10803/m.35797 type:complete len:295 (+) Transcript_10803:727-1611(+)
MLRGRRRGSARELVLRTALGGDVRRKLRLPPLSRRREARLGHRRTPLRLGQQRPLDRRQNRRPTAQRLSGRRRRREPRERGTAVLTDRRRRRAGSRLLPLPEAEPPRRHRRLPPGTPLLQRDLGLPRSPRLERQRARLPGDSQSRMPRHRRHPHRHATHRRPPRRPPRPSPDHRTQRLESHARLDPARRRRPRLQRILPATPPQGPRPRHRLVRRRSPVVRLQDTRRRRLVVSCCGRLFLSLNFTELYLSKKKKTGKHKKETKEEARSADRTNDALSEKKEASCAPTPQRSKKV